MHTIYTIPNLLTLLRIALLPLLVRCIMHCSGSIRILVFVLIMLTDFFDGYLARKWDQVSNFGALLDPVADKLFVLGSYTALYVGAANYMPTWFLLMLYLKESLLVIGAGIMYYGCFICQIRPTLLAKLLMVMHCIFLCILLCNNWLYTISPVQADYWYIALTVLSILVLGQYTYIGLVELKKT